MKLIFKAEQIVFVLMLIGCSAFQPYPAEANGVVKAVQCNNCSNSQMANKALASASTGTVYVFNSASKGVGKYSVYFEYDDGAGPAGGSAYKVADLLPAENDLKAGYRLYIEEQEATGGAEIELPPSFMVGSAAHALLDPEFSNTAIESHLSGIGFLAGLSTRLRALITAALAKNIPFSDVSNLYKSIRLTIKFPDGSTQEIILEVSINANTLENSWEIQSAEDERGPAGAPVPRNPLSFDGWGVSGGNVQDWIEWAIARGIPITNGEPESGCRPTGISCQREPDGIVRCTASYKCD